MNGHAAAARPRDLAATLSQFPISGRPLVERPPSEEAPGGRPVPSESPAEVEAVRDLVADDTRALSPRQRHLLAELLDGVASGLRVVVRIAERHPDEPATQRAAEAISWEQVAQDYARLLAQWSVIEEDSHGG